MAPTPHEAAQTLIDVSLVYIMGGCFVLGSMCTLFLLLILDFVRRDKTAQDD